VNRPFETETSTRGVVAVLILLLAAVALVLAAAGSLMRIWNLGETVVQRDDARQPPPGLEAAPQRALQAYVAEKQRLIQSYAPVEGDTHLAQIPVDEAMRALAAPSGRPAAQRAAYLMGLTEDEP